MFVIGIVLFLFGIASIFVAIYAKSNIMYLVYAGLGAMFFMMVCLFVCLLFVYLSLFRRPLFTLNYIKMFIKLYYSIKYI